MLSCSPLCLLKKTKHFVLSSFFSLILEQMWPWLTCLTEVPACSPCGSRWRVSRRPFIPSCKTLRRESILSATLRVCVQYVRVTHLLFILDDKSGRGMFCIYSIISAKADLEMTLQAESVHLQNGCQSEKASVCFHLTTGWNFPWSPHWHFLKGKRIRFLPHAL